MISNNKRFIRLKEYRPFMDEVRVPGDDYIDTTDGTLAKREFRIRADGDGYLVTGGGRFDEAPAILAIGDSAIENFWIEEDNRICALLEKKMREEGYSINVLNAGVSGANILHSLIVLLSKGLAENLAGILYMGGAVDAVYCSIEGSFWTRSPDLKSIVTQATSDGPAARQVEMELQGRRRLLGCLAAIADIHELPLWVATFHNRKMPCGNYNGRPDEWAAVVAANKMINQSTRDFCNDKQRRLVDLDRLLDGQDQLLYDRFHLNEKGCPVVADIFFREIVEVLPRPRRL